MLLYNRANECKLIAISFKRHATLLNEQQIIITKNMNIFVFKRKKWQPHCEGDVYLKNKNEFMSYDKNYKKNYVNAIKLMNINVFEQKF